MTVLPREDREEWLISYMEKYTYISTMETDAIRAYAEASGVALTERMVGPPDCPTFAADLLRLFDSGLLKRTRAKTGYGGWSYHYRLGYAK